MAENILWFKNPKLKWALWAIAGAIVVYLALATWVNKIHISERKLYNAWSVLKENCDRRTQSILRFGHFFQSQGAQAILQPLSQAYKISKDYVPPPTLLTDPIAVKQFVVTQEAVVAAFSQMEEFVAKQGALAQNRQYLMLRMELQNIEQQIQFSVGLLQKETRFYNYYITGFPYGWLNSVSVHSKQAVLFEVPTLEKTKKK